MKKVFCVLVLLMLSVPMLAQNTDKDTRLRSTQEMTYEAFEATLDAIRNTFVPGYSYTTATIDSGTALSDSLDLTDSRMIGFVPDSAWTTANITFLTWNPITNAWVSVFDDGGSEVSYSFTDSTYTAGVPTKLAGLRYVKIRSGTDATPVNQAYSDKRVGIILRRY